MAKHGFDSVTIKLLFKGPNVEQEMQVLAPRLGEHDDILAYISTALSPKLSALSAPADAIALREQVAKLEKSVAELSQRNAELEALQAARQRDKKSKPKGHASDVADDAEPEL